MIFSIFSHTLTFTSAVISILACLLIVFLILPFHEWAHGFVAYKLGDNTAKYQGRLSFNPLAHIDPFGALCLLLFNFGWAKPVPVNPRNFKNPKVGMAITALAGPVANVVAALAGGLVLNLILFCMPVAMLSISGIWYYIVLFLYQYIAINACLAVFNLIPIPPLDGSKILFTFLPNRIVYMLSQNQMIFFILIYILLFTGVLSGPLAVMQNWLISTVVHITALPFLPFA